MMTASKTLCFGALSTTIVVASLFATGCGGAGGSKGVKALREAASTDFNCPKHQVVILTSSGKTRDVDVCGQRATYRFEDGDWLRIRSEQSGGGGVSAPAPGHTLNSPQPGPTPSQPPPGKQL